MDNRMTQEIQIVLADDHAILRSGLKLLLNNQDGWQVVGEASTGVQTVELVKQLQPDILILDLNMPDGDGLWVIHEMQASDLTTKILVLTMHEDGSYLQQVIQSGASGYVLKKAVDTELITAIQAVLRDEIYVHPAMTHYLLKTNLNADDTAKSDPWQQLSEREFDVLRRVALGYTNSEIAEELFLSVKTVETYRARAMDKLNLQTRAQLVKSAIDNKHLEE